MEVHAGLHVLDPLFRCGRFRHAPEYRQLGAHCRRQVLYSSGRRFGRCASASGRRVTSRRLAMCLRLHPRGENQLGRVATCHRHAPAVQTLEVRVAPAEPVQHGASRIKFPVRSDFDLAEEFALFQRPAQARLGPHRAMVKRVHVLPASGQQPVAEGCADWRAAAKWCVGAGYEALARHVEARRRTVIRESRRRREASRSESSTRTALLRVARNLQRPCAPPGATKCKLRAVASATRSLVPRSRGRWRGGGGFLGQDFRVDSSNRKAALRYECRHARIMFVEHRKFSVRSGSRSKYGYWPPGSGGGGIAARRGGLHHRYIWREAA